MNNTTADARRCRPRVRRAGRKRSGGGARRRARKHGGVHGFPPRGDASSPRCRMAARPETGASRLPRKPRRTGPLSTGDPATHGLRRTRLPRVRPQRERPAARPPAHATAARPHRQHGGRICPGTSRPGTPFLGRAPPRARPDSPHRQSGWPTHLRRRGAASRAPGARSSDGASAKGAPGATARHRSAQYSGRQQACLCPPPAALPRAAPAQGDPRTRASPHTARRPTPSRQSARRVEQRRRAEAVRRASVPSRGVPAVPATRAAAGESSGA